VIESLHCDANTIATSLDNQGSVGRWVRSDKPADDAAIGVVGSSMKRKTMPSLPSPLLALITL